MDDTAIKVEHISKDFVLPHERNTSLKQTFINPFRSSMHKNTNKQHALKNISFDIKRGEFFGIVGRNGSGKSTLLKLIAGIYQPTKGTISVNGKLVPFIELGVGFNPELTGRQNIYLNGALLGFSKKEVQSMYNDIVEFAELNDFMDQKLKNYSSGMQVRLAFSMAIRADADILLIDEVLAVGDANFQRKCFDYFRQLKRNNKTVIFVSHDMNAIREYCDRVVMIEDSKLVAEGKPFDIADKYSKLFVQERAVPNKPSDNKKNRWGDGAIQYVKASVNPATVQQKDTYIEIKTTAKAYQKVETPIYGFSIKNEAGEYIMGMNTKIKKVRTKDVEEGEVIEIVWKIPNVFADGVYYVNPAVERADAVTECDWLEEAVSFRVYKDEKTPYQITPAITVQLSSSKTS